MPMIDLNRRHLLALLGAGAITAPRAFAQTSVRDIDDRLAKAQKDGTVTGVHALLVSKGSQRVFEYYGRGADDAWDGPLGTVLFAADKLHDLRSVTKSVVGLVYGIALAAGKVPPPQAKLYDQFPEYADLAREAGRDRLTVQHVLTMTLGLEWDELTIPYGDPRNSENAMEGAPDRFRFILERAIVSEPGVKWTYCGGATALLGRMIAKGTGEELLPYARRVPFDPLDFGPAEWTKGNDGEPHTASGLRLLPRDMLKIGELVLAGGAWNGRQIVPSDWVQRMTTPAVATGSGPSYGYQWYMGDVSAGTPPRSHGWVGGIGWGCQRLYVLPTLDLVVAVNCGNYDKSLAEQIRINRTLLMEIVLPSFV
jgi:CubicO group peptidase (beta-lactamase class C family)